MGNSSVTHVTFLAGFACSERPSEHSSYCLPIILVFLTRGEGNLDDLTNKNEFIPYIKK